ncbi:MAG TPA: PBP1A family penicillin-binding protein [Gemmatimonadaceae bacterium]|nr:PBP1A family penicillin-binding protein [Gemmatimonadaceae bacterium]
MTHPTGAPVAMHDIKIQLSAAVCGALLFLPAPAPAQQREPWQIITPPQASLVLARDGSLIGEVGRERRVSIALASLPPYVGQAFVAVEDQRFHQHDGVDVVGIAGALKDNLLGERRGASTITQQLVGNMHPDIIDRTDVSLGRKIREQQAAREMDRRYTKQQILEAYLNQIDFGHGWFGIETAARHYFGKPAARLTVAEAATLAAVPKGPALFDPLRNPDRVRTRRNIVLQLMAEQRYISAADARAAQSSPLRLAPNLGMSAPAQNFVNVVRIQATRAGVPVMNGGYRIYTSLDPGLQNAAVAAIEAEATAFESRPGYRHPTRATHQTGAPNYLQGVAVAIDPSNGDVRALVGGRDYEDSQFDRAVDGERQPGSAFKPIVYAAALSRSFSPLTMVADTAISIRLPNGTYYRPDNSDRRFLGPLTLREALAKSRNVVAVQLAVELGMDSVIAMARRMGISSAIAPGPASAIGASVVQPLDIVAAFTAFANLGTPMEPRFIHRIEDSRGQVVYSGPVRALPPAMDPRVAFVVREMMRDVVDRGTATSVRRFVPSSVPVAGKTGTTNDNTDSWFIGLTPDIVAGVWYGFDRPTPISGAAAGGSLAAPAWGRMVANLYRNRASGQEWTPPPGVISGAAERGTGLLATDLTPPDRRYMEYFVEGTEPEGLRLDAWRVLRWGPLQ